jgi:hypothetical protein
MGLKISKMFFKQQSFSLGEKGEKSSPELATFMKNDSVCRRLAQYEDCLKDIARAARFGYPRENFYKLWERKGKCYQGLARYDLAAKCYRQAMQCLKESSLRYKCL